MKLFKHTIFYSLAVGTIFLLSCEEETIEVEKIVTETDTVTVTITETDTVTVTETDTVTVTDTVLVGFAVPEKYLFTRDGDTTVSYSGQTTRLLMAKEMVNALKDETTTIEQLLAMFDHQEGANDFSDAALNASSKQVKNKTGNNGTATDAAEIRSDIESWMTNQVDSVFPAWTDEAQKGLAGYIQEAGGGSTRYVNQNGLENNQAVNKALIGALVADQVLNGYLTPAKLNAGTNESDQIAGNVVEGKSYTNMEHYWDEGYGYIYGLAEDGTDPVTTPGSADIFMLKYIKKVDSDTDFSGTAQSLFDAFVEGRAAVVAGEFEARDAAAKRVAKEASLVIAVRAAHYLKAGQLGLATTTPDMASVFHDLSEGFGFVYSLQFTLNPETDAPYFSRQEVKEMLDKIYPVADGKRGFWDVTQDDLQEAATTIATAFGFTYDNA